MSVLTGNEKRKASCKKIGSDKKKGGHKVEDLFGELFCDPSLTTYKAEADKIITNENTLKFLNGEIGPISNGATSIKSGKNIQFTLGKIPEITNASDKLKAISERRIWEKYLGKSLSNVPASMLCYKNDDSWIFFSMNDIIDFIVEKAIWRELDSGRIKGDFADDSRNGTSQYLTYEYRSTHGSYFLGANGNKGQKFIELLMKNLLFVKMVGRR
jgi:hypothetical protein